MRAADNLRYYLSEAVLPPVQVLDEPPTRCDSEGEPQRPGLTVIPASWRRLHVMRRLNPNQLNDKIRAGMSSRRPHPGHTTDAYRVCQFKPSIHQSHSSRQTLIQRAENESVSHLTAISTYRLSRSTVALGPQSSKKLYSRRPPEHCTWHTHPAPSGAFWN
jgi:hypothetical protein